MTALCSPVSTALLVADVIALYLRHSVANNVHCPAALADRRHTFALFTAACGHIPVAEAKPFHLTDFIDSHPSWRSLSTRRGKASSIRAAFQWAVDQERIDRNPFRRVTYAEAERRPDMPDDTLARIERLSNKRFEQAVHFLRLTGCRLTELCEATWGDIDFERGRWTIQKHKSRRYTQKARVLALVPEAITLLRRLVAEAAEAPAIAEQANGISNVESVVKVAGMPAPTDLIFLNNRGTPWDRGTLGQQLRRMKKRHGITVPATLQGVRHRYGSCGVANGAPIKLISKQLGHASVAITERFYVNLDDEIEAVRNAAKLALPK